MLTAFISRCLVLIFGTIYPAYCSYKAIEHKNLKQYLHYLRYWVVFACFVVLETVCDLFICWIPFYYELKILIILCLLLPPGSTFVYKNFIQPTIRVHELDIDRFLEKTKSGGYNAVVNAGSRLLKYSSDMFINTALKGSSLFGSSLTRSASSNSIYYRSAAISDDMALASYANNKHCYSGQLANTIGATGQFMFQDMAAAFARKLSQHALNLNTATNTNDPATTIGLLSGSSSHSIINNNNNNDNDNRSGDNDNVVGDYDFTTYDARSNPMQTSRRHYDSSNVFDINDGGKDNNRNEYYQYGNEIRDRNYYLNEEEVMARARRPLFRQSQTDTYNQYTKKTNKTYQPASLKAQNMQQPIGSTDVNQMSDYRQHHELDSVQYQPDIVKRMDNVKHTNYRQTIDPSIFNISDAVVNTYSNNDIASSVPSTAVTTAGMLTRSRIRSIKEQERNRQRASLPNYVEIDTAQ